MNETNRQTHREYIKILKRMTPQARLQKAFELSDLTKSLFITGLKMRYPDYSEEDIKSLYIEKYTNVTIPIIRRNHRKTGKQ